MSVDTLGLLQKWSFPLDLGGGYLSFVLGWVSITIPRISDLYYSSLFFNEDRRSLVIKLKMGCDHRFRVGTILKRLFRSVVLYKRHTTLVVAPHCCPCVLGDNCKTIFL